MKKNEQQQQKPQQPDLPVQTQQNLPAQQLNLSTLSDDQLDIQFDGGKQSFLDEFEFSILFDNNEREFVLKDNSQKDPDGNSVIISRFKEFECSILHAFNVYKLPNGILAGAQGNYSQWSDKDKKPAAISYSSPFSQIKPSRGNFDLMGLGQYLNDEKKRELVKKRLVIVAASTVKGFLPRRGKIAMSFGGTSIAPFGDFVRIASKFRSADGKRVPIPFLKTKVFLKNEKNRNGEDYKQINFLPVMENGKEVYAWDIQTYLGSIYPAVMEIQKLHETYIKSAEESIFGKSNDYSDSVADVSNHQEPEGNQTNGGDISEFF